MSPQQLPMDAGSRVSVRRVLCGHREEGHRRSVPAGGGRLVRRRWIGRNRFGEWNRAAAVDGDRGEDGMVGGEESRDEG
jgi:hypothetical protein